MEHIVQIAVGVDDKRIVELIEESAAKQIAEDIKLAAHGATWNNKLNDKPEKLKELFQDGINEFIKANADKIVEEAIKEATKSIMKTKVMKEAVGNLAESVKE